MVNELKAWFFAIVSALTLWLFVCGFSVLFVFMLDMSTIREKATHLVEWAILNEVSFGFLIVCFCFGMLGLWLMIWMFSWDITKVLVWDSPVFTIEEKDYILGKWSIRHPQSFFKKVEAN